MDNPFNIKKDISEAEQAGEKLILHGDAAAKSVIDYFMAALKELATTHTIKISIEEKH